MMTAMWERIIESISYVKLKTINKEKIKSILEYDRTHDSQVLDSLYILGVLTIEEYTAAMERYIVRLDEQKKWTENQFFSPLFQNFQILPCD